MFKSEIEKEPKAYYKVVPSELYGISKGTITFGMQLEYIPAMSNADLLLEEIRNGLAFDGIDMDDDEFEVGKIYKLVTTNHDRHWETGELMNYDITFVPVELL